ncbi:hypothetical protein D210916BOD24_30160 [Alteromonas sp. D210916BOD_24]|uniref:hypothetical protein n=1 Tax=Alteromonas sp. D210916BOD_24 TaxID=3157618 RepID=UPI00399D48CC
MRVSLVMLAFYVPALFSSLLAFSPMGEGNGVQTASGDDALNIVSVLVSEFEQESTETGDDESDNDVVTGYALVWVHNWALATDSLFTTPQKGPSSNNEIRGPPSFS